MDQKPLEVEREFIGSYDDVQVYLEDRSVGELDLWGVVHERDGFVIGQMDPCERETARKLAESLVNEPNLKGEIGLELTGHPPIFTLIDDDCLGCEGECQITGVKVWIAKNVGESTTALHRRCYERMCRLLRIDLSEDVVNYVPADEADTVCWVRLYESVEYLGTNR